MFVKLSVHISILIVFLSLVTSCTSTYKKNIEAGNKAETEEEKLKYYTRAIEVWSIKDDKVELADLYYKRASLLFNQEKYEEAYIDISRGILLVKENSVRDPVPEISLRGKIFYRRGQTDEAIKDLTYGIEKKQTTEKKLRYYRALAYLNKGLNSMAYTDLLTQESEDPDFNSRKYLVMLASASGEEHRAKKIIESVNKSGGSSDQLALLNMYASYYAKHFEDNGEFYQTEDAGELKGELLYAKALLENGRHENQKAKASLRDSLVENARFSPALLEIGIIEYNEENYDQSFNLLDQAITVNNDWYPYRTLGVAHLYRGLNSYQKGNCEKAIEDLTSAVTLGLSDVKESYRKAYIARASCYDTLGEKEKAELDRQNLEKIGKN